jgi:peptidoglycan/xylan/chitin deacetylase (PgdA/CDA1 family)
MRRETLVPICLWGLGTLSCAAPPLALDDPTPAVDASESLDLTVGSAEDLLRPVDLQASGPPMYLNGSFDGGSSPFRTWVQAMEFARELRRVYGKSLPITFFLTTAFLDTTVTGSSVGRAQSPQEILVRTALIQQAVNEGHEIANHTVRHLDGGEDGGKWPLDKWRSELLEFQRIVTRNVFQPVLDDTGTPLFPRWLPLATASPHQVGAACSEASPCDGGLRCVYVSKSQGLCSQDCNDGLRCPSGTYCGLPDTSGATLEFQDLCLPLPQFPIVYKGQTLFRADGTPNLSSALLRPYQVVGFRAPYLSTNEAMYDALKELNYVYDSSDVAPPEPAHIQHGIFQFALMKMPGMVTYPMDYSYYIRDTDRATMTADYQSGIVQAYQQNRMPWNIGHHLRMYKDGVYFEAFKDAFRFAAQGCPDDKAGGRQRCPNLEFVSFRELAQRLSTRTP